MDTLGPERSRFRPTNNIQVPSEWGSTAKSKIILFFCLWESVVSEQNMALMGRVIREYYFSKPKSI